MTTALHWEEDEARTEPRSVATPLEDTVPPPPPVPLLARDPDDPREDDGLWNGDELMAGRAFDEAPSPSAFGDHYLGNPPPWRPEGSRSAPAAAGRPSRATRGSDTVRWLMTAALAAVAALVTWQIIGEGSGSLEIRLVEADRHPEVDVRVDGVSRCGSTPCLLSEVAPGPHVVEIGSRDGQWLRRQVEVEADAHSLLSLAFPSAPPSREE